MLKRDDKENKYQTFNRCVGEEGIKSRKAAKEECRVSQGRKEVKEGSQGWKEGRKPRKEAKAEGRKEGKKKGKKQISKREFRFAPSPLCVR